MAEQEQELAGKIAAQSSVEGELTVEDEQERTQLTEAEVAEAKAVEATAIAEAEETAGVRAFGKQETCSTCRHTFQGKCERHGTPRTVKPDGHCSKWE